MPKMIDSALDSLATNVAADIYLGVKRWFAALDPGGSKLEDYRDGLVEALGTIQIMGMPSARKLEQIYIALKAVPNIRKLTQQHTEYYKIQKAQHLIANARKILNAKGQFDIDRFIDKLGYSPIDIPSSEDDDDDQNSLEDNEFDVALLSDEESVVRHGLQAIDMIKDHDRLFILGNAGSGKTTFLKYIALAYSGHLPIGSQVTPLLPIFVPLREVARVSKAAPTAEWLRDLILACASDVTARPFAKEWLDDLLKKGQCIILLDGIDEVPTDQLNALHGSIKSFGNKYRRNKIVATCRVAAFERSIEGFHVCEVNDFDGSDIDRFIIQWFGQNSPDGIRLRNDLGHSRSAQELCKTPLLLTMICILYGYRRTIPRNRAELYEACVDALLFRWDTSRAIDRETLTKIPISVEKKKMILARVANRAFARDVIYFQKEVMLELLQAELDYLDLRDVSATDLLKEIESHSGLLSEYSIGVFRFSHLTFHEFFVAMYYHDTKEYADLFIRTVDDSRYLEVFLMCCEKMYNADKIAMQIISHVTNECIKTKTYDEYLHVLIGHLLASNASINFKLIKVLEELMIRLEKLEIDDGSTIES